MVEKHDPICSNLFGRKKVIVIRSASAEYPLRSEPGTYVLILSCSRDALTRVGRLGQMRLQTGFYLYIGSALGPGGLGARIAHHRKRLNWPHWHIDYLRPQTQFDRIWYCHSSVRSEHQWAQAVKAMSGAMMPIAGFGSSDCNCESHLYFFRDRPLRRDFERSLTHTTS